MLESLADWPRPHFKEPGGRPFLFFVVFGSFAERPALSRREYRSDGVPPGFTLGHYDVRTHSNVVNGFRDGYPWDELQARSPDLAATVAASSECIILRGEVEDSETLNYLRDSVGLLTYLLDNGGVAVYDPLMFYWWSPAEWHERIFSPQGPVPRHHVMILTSEEADPQRTWFHTRGMRKFGRPELSVHDVGAEHREAIIDLCSRFIELLAFGGKIAEGQEIRMRSLPDGMICEHRGDLDDPDFNNVHVEINYPRK